MTVGKRKRSKFGNRRVVFQGMTFDSILERDRWIVLCGAQERGEITGLERQVRYKLTAHDEHICDYIADFEYLVGYRLVTDDSKGMVTDVFRIKSKLFRANFGRQINIIKKQNLHSIPSENAP